MKTESIYPLLEQLLILLWSVLRILAIGYIAGWGVTLKWAPQRIAFRWVVFTPIIGFAVITAFSLPISLLGAPVHAIFPILLLFLGCSGFFVTAKHWQRYRFRRRRRFLAYVRRNAVRLAILSGIVTSLSTYMMTARTQSDVRDVWGSSDFAAYWGVSEYLLHFGANKQVYSTQLEYRSSDIQDHLSRYARLGSMVYIASLGMLEAPHFQRIINPIIVTAMCLLIALGMVWLETINCPSFWPLLLVACHPFLYFLLYFSYASQATGVILTLAGLLIAHESLGRSSNKEMRYGGVAVAGLLFGAAILHHPTMALIITAILGFLIVQQCLVAPAVRRLALLFCLGLVTLLSTSYYLPATWRELTILSGPVLAGWEWRRPIGFNEIAGVGSVLGYSLPAPLTTGRWILEIGFGIFLMVGAWLGWRERNALPIIIPLAGATAILAAATLPRVLHHVPNATHSYVKVISFFVLVLLLGCLAGWDRWLSKHRRIRLLMIIPLCFWIVTELRAVRFGNLQEPRYREPLIVLARREISKGAHLVFTIENLDEQLLAPIVRNIEFLRIIPGRGRTLAISRSPSTSNKTIVDRAEPYVAYEVEPRFEAK